MSLPDSFLQELKMRNPIEEVVSSYVKLKRAGRIQSGLCPFHSEKTPSFTIYPESDSFYCFGCGSGGDTISFIRQIENLDYMEAIRFLAQRSNMTVPEDAVDDGMAKARRRVLEANVEAARFFYKCLYSPEGKHALDYLYDRGLTDATIRRFGLGYSPDSWDSLIKALGAINIKPPELVEANLAVRNRNGGFFDIFRNRVMFPIIDLRGNVIAFGGRVLEAKADRKYVNTSDTIVYKKSQNVFALNLAKGHSENDLILVEGYMDVITLHQAGFQNAIASLGTALTSEQAKLLSRYAKRAIICYDSDDAGRKATAKAIPILKRTGLEVRVLTIPAGKDPDEYIKTHGAVRFKNLLSEAPNDIEYQLSVLRENHNNCQTDNDRVAFLKNSVELLASLSGAIERDIYMSRLAQELSIDKSAIQEQYRYVLRRKSKKEKKEEIRNLSRQSFGIRDAIAPDRAMNLRAASAEEALIAYILRNPDKLSYLCTKIRSEDFVTDFNRHVYDILLRLHQDNRELSITALSEYFENAEMSRIASWTAKYADKSNLTAEAIEYISVIRQESTKGNLDSNSTYEDIYNYLDRLKEMKK